MTGGSVGHNLLRINILVAPWQVFGADGGAATVGATVRYPDALVASAAQVGTSKLVTGPVVVVEVLSPTSSQTDRSIKVKEYRAVPTIRRYLRVEHTSIGVTAHHREAADADWMTTPLVAGDMLASPVLGIEVPLAELCGGTDLPETEPDEER